MPSADHVRNRQRLPFPAASGDPARQVFVRADGRAAYADVARVMAALSVRGYRNLNLITETGGPPAGPPPQAPAVRPGTP